MMYKLGHTAALAKLGALTEAHKDLLRLLAGMTAGAGISYAVSEPKHRARNTLLGAGADAALLGLERTPDLIFKLRGL